ncbi:hypothetical protein D3C87_1524750 [compost metagenome]
MLGENRADFTKLREYLRLAIGIGADIEHNGITAPNLRHQSRDGRTKDTFNGFNAEKGANVHCACISCTAEYVHLFFFQKLETYSNAGIGFLRKGFGRMFPHLDHIFCVNDVNISRGEIVLVEDIPDHIFTAN